MTAAGESATQNQADVGGLGNFNVSPKVGATRDSADRKSLLRIDLPE